VPLIQLTNIEKILGDRLLFDKMSFQIDKGERVGLIGENGAGKTTFFKLITGEVKPDLGDVSIAKGGTIGLLSQDPTFAPGSTLIDEAELAFKELHDLAHEMREIEHQMAENYTDKLLEKYSDVQHDFEIKGGYAWRHKLEAVLDGVGLSRDDWEKQVDSLSGGQRSRLALAKLLVAEPDLLMLDEPTNHLDIAATEWLENWLLNFGGAVIVISHDRYLLDRIGTRIVWLTQRKFKSYPGNYAAFEQLREIEMTTQQRAYEEQKKEIDKQSEYVRRFKAGQRARQAKGRETRLNRFLSSDQMIQQVQTKRAMNLKISTDQRAGDMLLRVTELSKKFDDKQVWSDIAFELKRGDRVGIIGPNGSGKTTLLKTLTGNLDADAGEVRWGSNITIGYYDQRLDDFDPDNTAFEEVLDNVEGYNEQQLRDAMGAMLFGGDDVDKPMHLLSGGEKARVALTKLLLNKPNVLLLDEPTNHLDIKSVDALERALDTFPGSILCVSHDRHFLDKVAKRLLVLDPPGYIDFEGNWSKWRQKQQEIAQQAKSQSKPAKQQNKRDDTKRTEPPRKVEAKPQQNQPKKDNPYSRTFGRLSVSEIEAKIVSTETELARLQREAASVQVSRDPGKSKQARQQIDKTSQTLRELEQEYFLRGQS